MNDLITNETEIESQLEQNSSSSTTDILPLITMLAQEKPITSGLLVSSSAFVHAQYLGFDWQTIALDLLETSPFVQRFDLAVCQLQQLDNNQKQQLSITQLTHGLTRLRDLLARRVLVITDKANQPEQHQLLRALGFSPLELPLAVYHQYQNQAGEQGVIFWQFNILAYKQVPDWLNAKFWANPQNWGKFRW